MPRLANSPAQLLLHPLRMTSLRNGLGAPSPCASTAEVICTLFVSQARYKSRHPMQPSDPRRRPLRRNTQQAQSCMQRHKKTLSTSRNYPQLNAYIYKGKGHKSELNSPMPSSLSSASLGTLPGCHILSPDLANRQHCSRSSSSSAMYFSFRPQPVLMPNSILD